MSFSVNCYRARLINEPRGTGLSGLRPLAAFRRTPADNLDTPEPFVTDVRLPHHKPLARTSLISDPSTVLLPNDMNIYDHLLNISKH